MLFRVSNETENINSAIKSNTGLMVFIVIMSLLNFGFEILNIVFLISVGIIIITYSFLWNKMNTKSQCMFVGLCYFVNSISMFIMGFVLADIQHKVLASLIIAFYIIEYIAIIYLTSKSMNKKNDTPSYNIKYSKSILLSASSLGLIISRYLRKIVSYDRRLWFSSLMMIGMSFFFAIGTKYFVFQLIQVTAKSSKN